MSTPLHLIKLGGSLLDLPDLPQRLAVFHRCCIRTPALLLVGGAEAADIVRRFDAQHHLDAAISHRLAIRAMQLNAHLMAAVLPDATIVRTAQQWRSLTPRIDAHHQNSWSIIDPVDWLDDEERRGVTIPHRWSFTSDSIAAHLAVQLQAHRLTLLKSTLSAESVEQQGGDAVEQAADQGVVDADFPAAARSLPHIELINLRHGSLASGRVDAQAVRPLRGDG